MARGKAERGGRGLRHDPPAHAANCAVPVVSGIKTVRAREIRSFGKFYDFDVREGAVRWYANKSAKQIGAADETAFFNYGPCCKGRLGLLWG